MRIYVAGPVTGIEENNRPAFERARVMLADAGFSVLVPHDLVRGGETWRQCMRVCLSAMLACDGVCALEGWQASKGAKLELKVARSVGMPVNDLETWTVGRIARMSEV